MTAISHKTKILFQTLVDYTRRRTSRREHTRNLIINLAKTILKCDVKNLNILNIWTINDNKNPQNYILHTTSHIHYTSRTFYS